MNQMKQQYSDVLQSVLEWQRSARPVPTDRSTLVALGVHIEEISEMFDALGAPGLSEPLNILATHMKTGEADGEPVTMELFTVNRKELLDALCDQIVTAIGVGHMLGLDVVTGLQRVNDSNWSKFVDNKPVFDENGKIKKSVNYVKPDLEGLY